MTSGKLIILISLLTSHRSACQNQSKIRIFLKSYIRDYSPFSCHTLDGMVQGADHMILTGNLTIIGFTSSFNATFGLLSEKNPYRRLATQMESSSCPQPPQVGRDTCACTYLDLNELQFTCNLTASCKMSDHLYFYMNYNNTYYYTDLISIVKTHARCEVPKGPFSMCVDGQEKRTVTDPFNRSLARSSCTSGLLHGVDRFNMTGRVNLNNLSPNSTIFVNFGVALRNDNTSHTFLGTAINFHFRNCVPLNRKITNTCACLGVEPDGFRVVCKFLATLEHSQKFGFFEMSVEGHSYFGDLVRMPIVIDECEEMPEMAFLDRLMYITLMFLLVIIIGALLYIFVSRPEHVDVSAVQTYSPEEIREPEEKIIQSNVNLESSVDAQDEGYQMQSLVETVVAAAEKEIYEFRKDYGEAEV